ncbi:hypothetical protein AMJ49_05340 [Parcubacteria bacterium DG_74_2]|nr:MAG: hypothetical protein AMJ49_05340 [Parcubacteria bacterium DG_74_2]
MKNFFFEGSKEKWDCFLSENKGSFLQGFEWGEFQKRLSKKIWRFEIREKNKTIAEAQIIKENFPLNKSCLYIPFGPCFDGKLLLKGRKEVLNLILKELGKIAKKENAIFLKVEPISPLPKNPVEVTPQKRIQPQKTLILNLRKTEKEIFSSFHPKTRYNIKLSERKGARVISCQLSPKQSDETSDATGQAVVSCLSYFDSFYKLIQKTAKRDKFKPYSKEYYRKFLEITNAELFLAVFENKIIAGNIVVFFGEGATYLHGASDYKFRRLMAPHLLQWKQICEAKEKGCQEYDFWGIDKKNWVGLTRFKRSFRGEDLEYPKGKDFIFSNFWYKTYILSRKKFL